MNKDHYKPITIALLVAVIVHLQLLLTDILPCIYDFWSNLFSIPLSPLTQEVTIVTMTPSEWKHNKVDAASLDAVKISEHKLASFVEEPEQKSKQINGQVVDVAPQEKSNPPKQTRLLSEYNTSVEKESVSREQRSDYGVAQVRPTRASSLQEQKAPKPSSEKQVAMVRKKHVYQKGDSKEEPSAFELPDIKKRDALRLKMDLSFGSLSTYDASEFIKGNSDRLRFIRGLSDQPEDTGVSEKGTGEKLVMFRDSSADQVDMVFGAPSNDYIKDIPKGAETLLNTREFMYATFFNRVKQRVSQYWTPLITEEYFQRDPRGNIYGVQDRYTVLYVALNANGELADISVKRSSGLTFVDNVALRSFRKACPFPNPPHGLVDQKGYIRFDFGFFFQIENRSFINAFGFAKREY